MRASGLLLILAVWTSWLPPEILPVTPIVVVSVCLALTPWGLRRSSAASTQGWLLAAGLLLAFLAVGAASGWDRARAVQELALLVTVAVVAWLASRERPAQSLPVLLGLTLSLLACWALWQVTVSFTALQQVVTELPAELQETYAQRLAVGRPFASLPVSGHLAILLATALTLLLPGGTRHKEPSTTDPAAGPVLSVLRWIGSLLCVLGIVLSRSVLGAGLACCACTVVLVRRHIDRRPEARRLLATALMIGAIGLVVGLVLLGRGDLSELEPIRLRLDNWRSAVWVWSGSPIMGVGLGGFGQASQAVPFAVGNRPIHAHCLPLELLADLGPIGLGLLALLVLWLLRLLRTLWPRHPALAVAVSLVPLHNLLDFSLYVSGVAIPWAVLLGWSVALARDPVEQPTPAAQPPGVRRMIATIAALALLATLAHTASTILEHSAAAQPTPATTRIALASSLAPWRTSPVELQVVVALTTRREQALEDARRALRRGRWLRPHSARLASLEARLALAQGETATAIAAAWSASASQPWSDEHAKLLSTLLEWVEPDGDRKSP